MWPWHSAQQVSWSPPLQLRHGDDGSTPPAQLPLGVPPDVEDSLAVQVRFPPRRARSAGFQPAADLKICLLAPHLFEQQCLAKNVGHFSLLDKKVVNVLNQMPEKIRYLNGLRAYTGFAPEFVDVEKNKRKYGKTKMSFSKFLNLAFRGIFDYSVKPIRFIGLSGLVIAFGSIMLIVVPV